MNLPMFNSISKNGIQNKTLYHLSHVDLDGFGCQYITSHLNNEVHFFNCNYGGEKGQILNIKESIQENEDYLVLITDLGLKKEFCELAENLFGENILLIDHHDSGRKMPNIFDWYYLDTSKCATYLTYEYFKESLPSNNVEDLEIFSKVVNATDMWLMNDPFFNQSLCLSEISIELKQFYPTVKDLEHNYRFYIYRNIMNMINNGEEAFTIESNFNFITQNFLIENMDSEFIKSNAFILKHKLFRYQYEKAMERENSFSNIEIDGYKGKVFLEANGGFFQMASTWYNHEVGDVDFVINIKQFRDSLKLAFRSISEDIHLGDICKKYFNGGGHPKASGGDISLEKRIKIDEYIPYIENYLKNFNEDK